MLSQGDFCPLKVLTQYFLSLYLSLSVSLPTQQMWKEEGRERGGGRRVRVREGEGGRGRQAEREGQIRTFGKGSAPRPCIGVHTLMLELSALLECLMVDGRAWRELATRHASGLHGAVNSQLRTGAGKAYPTVDFFQALPCPHNLLTQGDFCPDL